ncbi:MAG: sulfotransferase [Piscirickettsiaceae bacterium]|nr:MAG: sulfotransferase [Piscirickettsiaceae bacterium]
MNYQSVIILGAPRSGTNMLRDVLCEFDGVGTWPCDEINYIWRHGNVTSASDEFTVEMAGPEIKNFIANEFDAFAEKQKLSFLVEKTCANSLRVPFVDKVMPEAKYIFIVRDGVDAVGSATLRWKAKLDIPYILKKIRYVPFSDLPYYAIRYFSSRLHRFFSKDGRLSFWGPQLNGLDSALKHYSLEEVCALQWQRCVELSEAALSKIPEDRVVRVKYETFVTQPESELSRVLQALGVDFDSAKVKKAVIRVSDKSIGKGRKALKDKNLEDVERLVASTLKRHGYEC